MSRLVLLSVWAEHEFGDPIPGPSTLNKYAKNGMISSTSKSREKLAGRNYSPLCRDGNETSDEKTRSPVT